MSTTMQAGGFGSIDLDGIAKALSALKTRASRGSSMTRAEAVDVDRERLRLKGQYTLLLMGLDASFNRLKGNLAGMRMDDVGTEGAADRPGVYLLRRSRKLAASLQHHNTAPGGRESFLTEYRRLVRRYNAMLKAGTLSKRTLRNDIRATLVDMARQLRRAGRSNPENGP
jgi:hypothetical protein